MKISYLFIIFLVVAMAIPLVEAREITAKHNVTIECNENNVSECKGQIRLTSGSKDYYLDMDEYSKERFTLSTEVDVDINEFCEDTEYGISLKKYENITNSMNGLIKECQSTYKLVGNITGDSHYFAGKYGNISYAYGKVYEGYNNCKKDKNETNHNFEVCKEELVSSTENYNSCLIAKTSYKDNSEKCTIELDDLKKSSKSKPLIYAAGAVAAYYFIFKKKKDKVESEREEAGYESYE